MSSSSRVLLGIRNSYNRRSRHQSTVEGLDNKPIPLQAVPRQRPKHVHKNPFLTKLPAFVQSPEESKGILISKLKQCTLRVADYITDDMTQAQIDNMRNIKLQTLFDIHMFIKNNSQMFDKDVTHEIIKLFKGNCFRMSTRYRSDFDIIFDDDSSGKNENPDWILLEPIYDLFLRMIISQQFDSKMQMETLALHTIVQTVELIRSPDQRERNFVKNIIHRLYAKFVPLRAFLRSEISSELSRHICDKAENDYAPYGIAELLEICGSIIGGFTVPINPEHISFLKRVLLPLHSLPNSSLQNFVPQLCICLKNFIIKTRSLAEPIIAGIIERYPRTSSKKEIIILCELDDILSIIKPSDIGGVWNDVVRIFCSAAASQNFLVAERGLFEIDSDITVHAIEEEREAYNSKQKITQMILKYLTIATGTCVLSDNSGTITCSAWNDSIVALATDVTKRVSVISGEPLKQNQLFSYINSSSVNETNKIKRYDDFWDLMTKSCSKRRGSRKFDIPKQDDPIGVDWMYAKIIKKENPLKPSREPKLNEQIGTKK